MRFVFISMTLLSGSLLALSGCGGSGSGSTTTSSGDTAGASGQGGSSGTGGSAGSTTGGTGGTGGMTCTPTAELCDGKDNNCDGKVDEGCACTEGQTQSCYSGMMGTDGVGSCKAGTQTCDAMGVWGPCMGEVIPVAETCNKADDDCNGTVDDMGQKSCGVGGCKVTVDVCADGQMNTCTPGMPSAEICDGIDNNCNQLTDETFPNKGGACDTGLLGPCKTGALDCVTNNGVTAPQCVSSVQPAPEMCDSVDNDCDGTVDNNVPGTGGTCDTGMQGQCAAGTISCQKGVVDCFSVTPASNETCDGADNDCNGAVDDLPGAGMPCDTGLLGACKNGINMCTGSGLQCVQSVQAAATDTCGDNVDNNCDGQVDEGCLYQFSGVATNLPIAMLNGWQQCYIDQYANGSTPLTTILSQCPKAKLLLGCRTTGSSSLLVAANAPRVDVIFDTGTGNTPHNANNVGWYYNTGASWGFAPQGDAINRTSCDTVASSFDGFAGADPTKRLCWHTSGGLINGGWRCGNVDSLNSSTAYERIVYQAD